MSGPLEDPQAAYLDKVRFGLERLPSHLQHALAGVDQGFTRPLGAALADVQRSREDLVFLRGVILGRALGTLDTGCQLGLISAQQYEELLGVLDQLKAR